MRSALPGVRSVGKFTPVSLIRIGSSAPRLGGGVTIKSTVVDSGNGLNRTSVLRPGLLIVPYATDGLWYRADGSVGDRNTGAAVTALETADGDWASKTISAYIDARLVSTVTLGAGDDTDAEVVTKLMADTAFAYELTATAPSGLLVVTMKETGRKGVLKVTSNLATAFGASGQFGIGAFADYRVLGPQSGGLEEWVDMLNQDTGVAADAYGETLIAGDFVTANLIGDTTTQGVNEALQVLTSRGSTFG